MSNRIGPLLLLIIIAMGCYILWNNPSTRGDMARIKNEMAAIPDKAIEGAAKVSNRIDDARIPQKTEQALDNIKDDFKAAKHRDRAQQAAP